MIHPAYNENTGTVLLEALVAGLPVLVSAVCGYAHYIAEANCGLVLDNPQTLGEQVNEVFEGGAEVIFDTTGHWLPAAVPALHTFGRIAFIAVRWTVIKALQA